MDNEHKDSESKHNDDSSFEEDSQDGSSQQRIFKIEKKM